MKGGGSVKGLTKDRQCTVCGVITKVSLYTSDANVKCPGCKKAGRSTHVAGTSVKEGELVKVVPSDAHCVTITKENIRLEIFRNRSAMEARVILVDSGEVIDRIPVNWKLRRNQLDYMSVSKVQAYEQCPGCFYRQYMSDDTPEDDGNNIYNMFGRILHETSEVMTRFYKDNGVVMNPEAVYDEIWKNHKLTGFSQYLEGKVLINDYFKRNPIDKRVDTCLEAEVEWRGTLGGVEFGAQLDYIGRIDGTTGIIKDYKTNRMPYTPDELRDNLQLRIYELICRRHLFPEITQWTTGFEMFRFGWQQCPPRSEEDLLDAERYVASVAEQIRNDNTWEERINNYCGFRKCRITCKTYHEYVTNPQRFIDVVRADNTDLAAVDKQRELMTAYEKVAKGRKDELAAILKSAIERAMIEGKPLVIDGSELSLYSQGSQSYRYYDTRNVLLVNNELGILDQCTSISKTKMDKVLKDKPALALALAGCLDTSYASPYIVKRKHNPKG